MIVSSFLRPVSLTYSFNVKKALGTNGWAQADLGFAKTTSYDGHSEDMSGGGEGGS